MKLSSNQRTQIESPFLTKGRNASRDIFTTGTQFAALKPEPFEIRFPIVFCAASD